MTKTMKVHILKKVYEMSEKDAEGVLKVAKEQVPFGVYAVKKSGQLFLLNMKATSRTQLKKMIREFKNQGFLVHSNGL
jgi:hypothetical protein